MIEQNKETAKNLGVDVYNAYMQGLQKPTESHHYCSCSPQSKMLIKWWKIGVRDSVGVVE